VRPNYAQPPAMFPCLKPRDSTGFSRRIAVQAAVLAKRLYANAFRRPVRAPDKRGIRVSGLSFQKINYPLRNAPVLSANPTDLCVAQIYLTFLCAALYRTRVKGAGTSRQIGISLGRTLL
jgi:hypothetical protein